MATISLTVDEDARAAYVRLTGGPVASSVEEGADVVVDLDAMRVVVGIELLDLDAEIPYSTLVERYHVHSDVVETLRHLRPSVSGFLSLRYTAEGTSTASRSGQVIPC